jgi:hypothetical protein
MAGGRVKAEGLFKNFGKLEYLQLL